MSSGEYKAISLFSGAMGLDVGLNQAGIDTVIGQDVDETCIRTMMLNGYRGICGDIREMEPDDILSACGLSRGQPFLICGGPPCQPFSTAGKRLGINDPRGSLFVDYARMVRGIRPRFFVRENVRGLLSSCVVEKKMAIDVILEEFRDIGYRVIYGILNAVDYGVPQFRERLVVIGSRDHENIFLPKPTHFRTHQTPEFRWKTLQDAIGDLKSTEDDYCELSRERKAIIHMIPQGGNWKDLPEDMQKKAMGGAFLSGGGRAGYFRRLSFSEPSPTLTSSPIQKATMLCHPTEDRPLSVAEYARIQQFPDSWEFCGKTMEKYRQIGNAVPIGLGKNIGDMLVSVAKGDESVKTKRYRSEKT